MFPYLLAGIFKGFGVYSKASAIAALALDCLFSALTCIPGSSPGKILARQRLNGQDGFGDCSVRNFFLGRFHLAYNPDDFADEFGFPGGSSPREFLFPLAFGQVLARSADSEL